MDSSFQSSFHGTRFNYPQNLTPTTRQSSVSSTFSARKSHQAGFRKPVGSSRYSISGRSIHSTQIIARSENNVVQPFGLPLPIIVNEAITFAEKNASVSINCSSNGWAWAVCGRKLLVWQYKESKLNSPKFDNVRTPQRRTVSSQCRELTLPHCDIGHKASLITVFQPEGQQMASCLSISPTGDVRFWPSIAHDGSSIDESGILEGQEFDELLSIPPIGYVLVTTTCSLVLLQFQLHSGRHTIVHKAVRPPSGFLGSIGKKFASIIIGSNAQERENRFLKMCAERTGSADWLVSVLSDKWIQRWSISPNVTETFLFEDAEIWRKIRDVFHHQIWRHHDITEVETFLLDMQAFDSNLIVFAAAINLTHTPQIHFALITLNEEQSTFVVQSFCPIKHNAFYSGDANDENLKLKFILNRSVAYVYGDRNILEVILNEIAQTGIENTEKIELPNQGDKIMAAIVYNQIPIFFSRLHGLVSISSSDFDNMDYLNNTVTSEAGDLNQTAQTTQNENAAFNLTIYDVNPDDVYNTNDIISQIKAAFIYHLKKNDAKCFEILNDLLEDPNSYAATELDSIINKIAADLAEDIPAADPRWEEQIAQSKYALGSSASMQIIQQLKEKQRAFIHFVEFLHTSGLWDRLETVTEKGQIRPTCHLLSDIHEKIVAAIALKGVHNTCSILIDEAIELALKKRNEQPYGSLTSQDLFYVKTTKMHELFRVLAEVSDEVVVREQSTSRISQILLDVTLIILNILQKVLKSREANTTLFAISAEKRDKFEYLPWTAMSGKSGIRDILLHMININLKHGARSVGERELRQRHYKNLVDLVDLVLDGRKTYLESIKGTDKYDVLHQQYESQRTNLIQNFVDDNQYDLGAKLAEKYLDFQTLVIICDRTKNQSRLDEYIERFKDHDFSQFAINWHLQQNKRGDLFERFKRNQSELTRFLGDHPSLAWVQAVFNGDLAKASRILLSLAQNETELVARKRTMLSLAKLTSLATDEEFSYQIEQINDELQLIEYQLLIPQRLLSIFGYDTDNPKVLKPEEIINLFIAEENESATEYDYQKALALVPYVEDQADVKHKIWCSAILRDKWDSYNINASQETLQQLMFFKLFDLCYFMDVETEDVWPRLEDMLEAPELGPLRANKSFQFLLKLGYEHIYETYNKK